MSEQLLPCPFCGSEDLRIHEVPNPGWGPMPHVRCNHCGGQGGSMAHLSPEELWNIRSHDLKRGGYTGDGPAIPGDRSPTFAEMVDEAIFLRGGKRPHWQIPIEFDPMRAGWDGWRYEREPRIHQWESPTGTHVVRYELEEGGRVRTIITVREAVVYDGDELDHIQVMEQLEKHRDGFVTSRSITRREEKSDG